MADAAHTLADRFVEHREVVIIGSGFGAVAAARKLAEAGKLVTIIAETTEHLFQPLLYQVATGILTAAEIAPPTRQMLGHFPNVDVRLGRAADVRPEANELDYLADGHVHTIAYQHLVAATGARQSYFGKDEFAKVTFALKTVDDAERLRNQLVNCFEQANTVADPDRRRRLLSFVIVGAGPTGVELAGQIQETAARFVTTTYRNIDLADVSVTLVEGMDKVLPPFGGRLSAYSQRRLEKAGVHVRVHTLVTDIAEGVVSVRNDDGESTIEATTVIWSAGVQANDFASVLADTTGCGADRAGRLLVNPDLTVGRFGNIFAVGDMTSLNKLPGQSPVAMQQGRHVARLIAGGHVRSREFRYLDKGSMAIIDTRHAITSVKGVKLTGLPAWMTWLAVHLYHLVGFRNRAVTVASWTSAFIGKSRPGFQHAQPWEPAPPRDLPRAAVPAEELAKPTEAVAAQAVRVA